MATKNIDTMVRHLNKVQTDIMNLADEKYERYDNMSESEQIGDRGYKLKNKWNRLYEAVSIIDKAIKELKSA